MVHWAWIGGAAFAGLFLGAVIMWVLVMASQGEDFKDRITRIRPKSLARCDAERRVMALSIERVK